MDLATLYELRKDYPKAIELYQQILAAESTAARSASVSGGLYIGQKKLDEALLQYHALEKIENDPEETRIKIALIYFEKGEYDRAATELNLGARGRARRINASATTSARCTHRPQEYAKAHRAAAAHRAPPRVLRRRAHSARGRSISVRTRHADGDPRDPARARGEGQERRAARAISARIYASEKQYTQAIVGARAGRQPRARQRSARLLARRHVRRGQEQAEGDRDDAAGDRAQSAERARRSTISGYTYAEQGERLDEAEKLIRRALAIEPDDGFYIDSLGVGVLPCAATIARAVEQLERAIEHAGDDPTVTEHLGDAYEKTGKTRDADPRLSRRRLRQGERAGADRPLEGKLGPSVPGRARVRRES